MDSSEALQRLETLTDKENEVLRLLLSRLSYQEIAEQLVISPVTVRTHANRIFSKLGIDYPSQIQKVGQLFEIYAPLVMSADDPLPVVEDTLEPEIVEPPAPLTGEMWAEDERRNRRPFWVPAILAVGLIWLGVRWIGGMQVSAQATLPTEALATMPQVTRTASSLSNSPTATSLPAATATAEVIFYETDYPGVEIIVMPYSSEEFAYQVWVDTFIGDSLHPNDASRTSHWHIRPAVQDITGGWALKPGISGVGSDQNGGQQFMGWGIRDDYRYLQPHGIRLHCWAETQIPPNVIFPIFEGKRTHVTLKLSLLRLGFVSADGTAITNHRVQIGTIKDSLTGNYIEPCSTGQLHPQTDDRGIAEFIVFSGEYYIGLDYPKNDPQWQSIGHIDIGQVVEEVLYFDMNGR